jgi:WD40 repeat protein/serine/threonine protein kinase
MPVALNDFVKNLEDSGIVSPSKLQNFLPPRAAPKDAQELAKQLVRSKTLTKYQAQEVYLGRARGLILGSYTILDKIGAGGMGQVFKAQHRRMDRIVAIKILPTAMTKDAAAVARFEREVRAAAKLEHQNIVTAHDSDEAGGVCFLVMQFVDGSDLSALVKKSGPVGVQKAVDYILQAAQGLAYAHKQGVVHRDIKPANLLVDANGTVKILDMGLARLENTVGADAATAAELTASGTIMGTVDYMAPEQALNTKLADAKSDIYSLGCTLHYLLVGKAPYSGETLMEKLLAHREQPIPDLAAAGIIPAELQAILEQMMAKEPADRYASMGDVASALTDCRAQLSEPSAAPPAGTTSSGPASALTFLRDVSLAPRKAVARSGQTKAGAAKSLGKSATDQPSSKRRGLRMAALGVGLLLIVGLGGFAGWRAWNVPRTEQLASSQPAKEKAVAQSLDLLDPAKIPATERYDWQPKQLVAVLGERRGAHGGWWNYADRIGQVAFSPDGSQLASYSVALKGVMLWDTKTLLPSAAFGEPPHPGETFGYTAGGKAMVVIHNGTKLWDLTSSKPVVERVIPLATALFACSPQDNRLATGWNDELRLWNMNKQEPELRASWKMPGGVLVTGMIFLDDGKKLLTSSSDSRLLLWNVTDLEPGLIGDYPLKPQAEMLAMATPKDGRVLATGAGDGTLRLWQLTGQVLEEWHVLKTNEPVVSVSFAPDGAMLASSNQLGAVHLWELGTDKPRKHAEFNVDANPSLAFSPDAKTLATFGREHIVRLWDVSVPEPTELFPPQGHRGWVSSIAFSPDGKHLVSGGSDKTVRLWDLGGEQPKQERVLRVHTEDVQLVRFSPDGKSLVTGAERGEIALWDLSHGDLEGGIVLHSQGPRDVRFGADGQLLLAAGFGNGQTELWNVAGTASTQRTLPPGRFGVYSAAFSPDGKLLAFGSDKIQILDIAGVEVKELVSLDTIGNALTFSPDGHMLACPAGHKGIILWDATQPDFPELTSLKTPPWNIFTITFTHDGQKLLAADIFGRVLCWDIASGRQIANPDRRPGADPILWQMPGAVRQLVVSSDDRYVASANSDGSIYILRLDLALAAATKDSD